MDLREFLKRLRDATERDVNLAPDKASLEAPLQTPTELLELFNCILDIRLAEDGMTQDAQGYEESPG